MDIAELRRYTGDVFRWREKRSAYKFVRCMAPALLAYKLSKGSTNTPIDPSDQITGRRKHFYDGMPELRVTFVSVDVVGLDLATEEDSSESHAETVEETDKAGDEIITPPERGTDDRLNTPTSSQRAK